MNVMFLVNERWFKTLCKTVLEADTFEVSISTEKHNIHAIISDKCYFKSIDKYCLGYDTIDTIKTDFVISRNFKNTKEFLSKLDNVLATFLNTSISDKHFFGNIDECINKILENIKETKRETETRPKRKPITTDIDMIKDFTKETTHAKSLLNSVYGITAERETHENDTAYKMTDIQFESFMCHLRCLPPCDFPPAIVLHQASEDMTDKQKEKYSHFLLDKGLAIYHNGEIVTAKGGFHLCATVHEPKTGHIYEIRIFKDGAFIRSYTFSLESFANNAFKMIENNLIDFPTSGFKVIELFKDGKHVKKSIIHFSEKLV